MTYPVVTVLKKHEKRLRQGYPWVFSNEIMMHSGARTLPPGTIVTLAGEKGDYYATAHFNPHSLIAARVLTRDKKESIDENFFEKRLRTALNVRERFFDNRCYRLVHAEADGLPGMIIDRFDDVLVVQSNTAGMTELKNEWLSALQKLFIPRAIIARNDSAVRAQEGLEPEIALLSGTLDAPVYLREYDARFEIDPLNAQKTGWFYDQRRNRHDIAQPAKGRTVLDGYCYAGGFAIHAALAGAISVTGLDRSDTAIQAAKQNALLNKVDGIADFQKVEIFSALQDYAARKKTFDIVVMDPPAFAKVKKDKAAGLKGYQKLARLAAACVAPNGLFLLASCSHHVNAEELLLAARQGLTEAGRMARILKTSGADSDHPVHPFLPESAYLKAITFALD